MTDEMTARTEEAKARTREATAKIEKIKADEAKRRAEEKSVQDHTTQQQTAIAAAATAAETLRSTQDLANKAAKKRAPWLGVAACIAICILGYAAELWHDWLEEPVPVPFDYVPIAAGLVGLSIAYWAWPKKAVLDDVITAERRNPSPGDTGRKLLNWAEPSTHLRYAARRMRSTALLALLLIFACIGAAVWLILRIGDSANQSQDVDFHRQFAIVTSLSATVDGTRRKIMLEDEIIFQKEIAIENVKQQIPTSEEYANRFNVTTEETPEGIVHAGTDTIITDLANGGAKTLTLSAGQVSVWRRAVEGDLTTELPTSRRIRRSGQPSACMNNGSISFARMSASDSGSLRSGRVSSKRWWRAACRRSRSPIVLECPPACRARQSAATSTAPWARSTLVLVTFLAIGGDA